MTPKAQITEAKIDKLLQNLKLHSKRNSQQSEREFYRMEENIGKL